MSFASPLAEAGWQKLPADYRIPATAPSLAQAREYCKKLAETHYENFHVASWLLPSRLRPHFHALYSYCRISDDLGDEVGHPEQSLALLDAWQEELDACYAGNARHPVFVALAETIRACDIPKAPFADLLTAFRQDQTVTRYNTMSEVLGYCRNSANPVGRLVLYVCGYRDDERFELSDHTCSALQLANFWQDVIRDYAKDRIYIPLADMAEFGVTEGDIASARMTPAFAALLKHEIAITRKMFAHGAPLIHKVDRELAVDLDLFSRGGLEVLRAIESQDYDVLHSRPEISKGRKVRLLGRAMVARLGGVRNNPDAGMRNSA
jgi:squalene synthase HpnC